jgi:hypothetical protein
MAGRKGKGSPVGKSVKSAGHQERLAAALRANLKRRKAKGRATAEGNPERDIQADRDPPASLPDDTSKSD